MRRSSLALLAAAVVLVAAQCPESEPPGTLPPDTVFVTDTVSVTDTVFVSDTITVSDPAHVARIDSLESALTVERAGHAAAVDSLHAVIEELREEPPDTTIDPPQPTAVTLTALPDTMMIGDTVAVTGALLDADGAEISTPASEWDVQITGGLRYAGLESLTNYVRAAAAGSGAVRYTHLPSGLETEASTHIEALPDTTVGQVGTPPDSSFTPPLGDWPDNEPAGLTTLTHIRGDSKDWPGWTPFGTGYWDDVARVAVVDDPNAKYGRAIEKRFFAGDVSGWGHPRSGAYQGPGQTFPRQIWKEVYVRIVFRYSPNWDWHSGGEKLWLANDQSGISATSVQLRNGVIFVATSFVGAPATHRFWLGIIPGAEAQTAPVWNRSILEGPYAKVGRSGYHTIEYLKRMHDPDAANGFIRFWLDGVEYTRFAAVGSGEVAFADVPLTNRQWGSGDTPTATGISTRLEFPMYWGGQGDVKASNDWIRISELYVSGR